VFTSLDGKLAFNIYTLKKASGGSVPASINPTSIPDFASHIGHYIARLKEAHIKGTPCCPILRKYEG
jgi:hypothetical protein